jgi:L-aspartate oxidase
MTTTGADRVLGADAVVVGTGVAGLAAARAMAPRSVLLVSKGAVDAGSTSWAQGGVAAAMGADDSPERHAADTIAVGAGLNDPQAVAALTADAAARIAGFLAAGGRFDLAPDGSPALGREAGHSTRRVLHADGDATGAEMHRALSAAASRAEHVTLVDRLVVDEIVVDEGRVAGVAGFREDGERILLAAPAVVVATGGAGRLWSHTTNPPAVTGDGITLAARAGVALADLEFVQFHPTALASGRDPMPLLTEALRGEGAVLVDEDGRRFMVDEHPDAELAPRDAVARANWRRITEGGRVFLDATAAVGERFPERFPTVYGICREEGIDPRTEPVPVSPAAHYHMGGIATDLRGRTSLGGLWAVGEASRTGVHGANRLASNSLLEGLVFGHRVGRDVAAAGLPVPAAAAVRRAAGRPVARAAEVSDVEQMVREVMWERVGVERRGSGLLVALETLDRLEEKLEPGVSQLRSMVTASRLIATAAFARAESRGGHFRADHPEEDPAAARSLVVSG